MIDIGIRSPGTKEMDDGEKNRQANDLQRELNQTGISRRAFLDRLTTLGVGFGVVSMGANKADAHGSMENAITVQSTNPALGTIIEEGRQEIDERLQNVAEYGGTAGRPGGGFVGNDYGRGYSRAYSRATPYSRAYNRGYNRAHYGRFYSRYGRTSYSRYGGGGGSGGGGYGGGGGGYGGR